LRARTIIRLVAAVTLALAPAACSDAERSGAIDAGAGADAGGDGAAGDAVGGTAAQAFDDFIADVAGGICSWLFRCCDLRNIDVLSMSHYLTEADCVLAQQQLLAGNYSESRLAMKDGRVTIDASLAAACVFRVGKATCTPPAPMGLDLWGRLATCPDPFVGHVQTGERCTLRDECVPGSRCVPGGAPADYTAGVTPEGLSPPALLSSAVLVFGTCTAYVKEGDRCLADVDCAPGLYCRGPEYLCARPAGDGEPCNRPMDIASGPRIACNDIDPAKPRLCAGDRCSRLPRDGEPCLSLGYYPPCDPDPALALSCVGMQFNGTGVCKQAVGVGAPCGGFGLPPCMYGLLCVPDASGQLGTCAVPPGIGQSCPDSTCAQGAVCDFGTSICVAAGARRDGEACSADFDCASQSCGEVQPDVKVCLPPTYYGGCLIGNAPI